MKLKEKLIKGVALVSMALFAITAPLGTAAMAATANHPVKAANLKTGVKVKAKTSKKAASKSAAAKKATHKPVTSKKTVHKKKSVVHKKKAKVKTTAKTVAKK